MFRSGGKLTSGRSAQSQSTTAGPAALRRQSVPLEGPVWASARYRSDLFLWRSSCLREPPPCGHAGEIWAHKAFGWMKDLRHALLAFLSLGRKHRFWRLAERCERKAGVRLRPSPPASIANNDSMNLRLRILVVERVRQESGTTSRRFWT